MLKLLIVEDNPRLRPALRQGLQATNAVEVVGECASGEEALELCAVHSPDVVLMDVQLAGKLNGIQAAVALRRDFARIPVVFYSIQDDDSYYRDFRRSGILSHYAYVRKSNYLLPDMILPLLQDAYRGRSFIDPEVEARVQEVRHKDEQDPFALLEPNELAVIKLLAQGLTNEQIAAQLGYHDKRSVARTNGQIYAAWGLDVNTTDEKVARTRAAIIFKAGRLLIWDELGRPLAQNERGGWVLWNGA